MVACVKIS